MKMEIPATGLVILLFIPFVFFSFGGLVGFEYGKAEGSLQTYEKHIVTKDKVLCIRPLEDLND